MSIETEIENARAEVKRLWRKACVVDGIDPKDKFVELERFSPNNQALKDYNAALRRYWNISRPFFWALNLFKSIVNKNGGYRND